MTPEITFEQIFSGRMLLMRAQRHIAQAGISRYGLRDSGSRLVEFRSPADEGAFFIVESLLCQLEREFDQKKKRCDRRRRRQLDTRAKRQAVR